MSTEDVVRAAIVDALVAMARKLERAGINPETVTDYCALRDRLSAWEGEKA